ncbi:hypothetical protein [Glutamicibacter sp. NPDC090743]|uniref:hypothetical protein n=1 Tax=Glutamicibacter sp. NPDC090743 TaxID=3364001 RepID=UPI003807AF5A
MAWLQPNIRGERIAAVEGTCTYAATIAHTLVGAHIEVIVAKPPRWKDQTGRGKSDEIDAIAAAI